MKYIKLFFEDIYIDFILLLILALYAFRNYESSMSYMFCISIFIVSTTLWIISRFQLGNSFAVQARATQLITHGIYSKIRNPMYIFSFISLASVIVHLQSLIGVILLLTLFLIQIKRIKKEEMVLESIFKENYLNYKRTTWF